MKYYDFLPIGSVVRLKGEEAYFMVYQRCIHMKEKNLPPYYDYGGSIYPYGFHGEDELYYWNRSQITKACFRGYDTPENQELVKKMNESIKGGNFDV